jgi:hypothetical protein
MVEPIHILLISIESLSHDLLLSISPFGEPLNFLLLFDVMIIVILLLFKQNSFIDTGLGRIYLQFELHELINCLITKFLSEFFIHLSRLPSFFINFLVLL